MLDALKPLLENNVISQEIKESIEHAWNDRITENREQVAQQLREEFAQKYEHDKQTMFVAVNNLITDQLTEELREFIHDRKHLAEMKVKYAKHMNHQSKAIEEFVTRQLASEITELHEDTSALASKFGYLEEFVTEALAQEITEFQTDKRDLAETKVRLIREGRDKLQRTREQFVQRAAVMVENVVTNALRSEISALKEDIDSARKHDFGRKIFEAFASEYSISYLNDKSETAKLLKLVKEKDSAIDEAAVAVVKAERIIESKQNEIELLKDAHSRKEIMAELLSPLNREQRAIMSDLMESVQTKKLTESFEKYLPSVVAGNTTSPTRKTKQLFESKAITGNRPVNRTRSEDDFNINELSHLAGIKN